MVLLNVVLSLPDTFLSAVTLTVFLSSKNRDADISFEEFPVF